MKFLKLEFSHEDWKQIEGTYELRIPILGPDGKEKYTEPKRYTLSDIDAERCAMVAQMIYERWCDENDIVFNSSED